MNTSVLWSLRLGYSSKQAKVIEANGIVNFLKVSFKSKIDRKLPAFLEEFPKTLKEQRELRKMYRNGSAEEKKKFRQKYQNTNALKSWWLNKMRTEEYPLREKMICFWHNHFVSSGKKVKNTFWLYQHHMILREHAFGNFKELTKQIIKSNAMVRYLDNTDNKKDKINENLSRELLELFTLGIGNYTEDDIKNGAKGLAGLGLGNEQAQYRKRQQDDAIITYFGKTGNFKADELIDIIFEQKNIPYLITKKILKWFLYDNPTEHQVKYYGDYLRKKNFEIRPLLLKIFKDEYESNQEGQKIKDPLVFILQLLDELSLHSVNSKAVTSFLKQQGMELFDQPNVKGWDGGKSWLTSQTYLQRNKAVDLLCRGFNINKKGYAVGAKKMKPVKYKPVLNIKNTATDNKKIISELSSRLLFQVNPSIQEDMETILKYDFDPQSIGAQNAMLRLFNYIAKTPEFQLV